MKFIMFFQKALIHYAAEKGNVEIVQLLLSFDEADINLTCISFIYFNRIRNFDFKYNFNLYY